MGKKELTEPTVLFAAIERKQHEALRKLAFKTHRSIADVAREAFTDYLDQRKLGKKARGPARRAA